MSLVRLLTAGKCLIGSGQPSRYHVTHKRFLPKFGAKQNPFRITTRPDRTPIEVNLCQPLSPPAALAQAADNEITLNSTQVQHQNPERATLNSQTSREPKAAPADPAPRPVAGSGSKTEQPKRSRKAGSAAANRGAALFKLPLTGLKRLFLRGKPAAPVSPTRRQGKSMVQGELSLDRVKVVRNDLSDSDLEIVTTKPRAAAPAQTVPRQPSVLVAAAKPAGTAWGRATGRWFGAGKSMS
jgi:hypothetical protein